MCCVMQKGSSMLWKVETVFCWNYWHLCQICSRRMSGEFCPMSLLGTAITSDGNWPLYMGTAQQTMGILCKRDELSSICLVVFGKLHTLLFTYTVVPSFPIWAWDLPIFWPKIGLSRFSRFFPTNSRWIWQPYFHTKNNRNIIGLLRLAADQCRLVECEKTRSLVLARPLLPGIISITTAIWDSSQSGGALRSSRGWGEWLVGRFVKWGNRLGTHGF